MVDRVAPSRDAGGQSRRAGIEVALLTLRLVEHLRAQAGDQTSAMVLLAVVAITSEKLTRSGLDEHFWSMETPMPAEKLASCNVSSIAAAIGMNRETARRHVAKLIDRGILRRGDQGTITFTPGYMQREETSELLQAELEVISRSVTELLRLGAITAE